MNRRRGLLIVFSLFALSLGAWFPRGNITGWHTIKVGPGGFVTGMSISADGLTKVVREDTYGAHVWDASISAWRPLLTKSALPAGLAINGNGLGNGAYEVTAAPNADNIIYMFIPAYVGSSTTFLIAISKTTTTTPPHS